MLVDIFNNTAITICYKPGLTDDNRMLYETLFPMLWTYFNNIKADTSNIIYNTVLYINDIDINKYVVALTKYAFNNYELKKTAHNDSHEYYYNNSFFVIDCNIFYGKVLLDFVSDIIVNNGILSKNIFIFTYFELIDKNTQNDIFSKGYRYIKSCNFIFVSRGNYNYHSISKFNLIRIPHPSFDQNKKYLQYFLKKNLKSSFFEPVLDKIILVSDNDIYQMLFMIDIFHYDPNVINRYTLETDINNLAQIMCNKLETDYYELRELLYTLLEKADFQFIIKAFVHKLLPVLNYNNVQRAKAVSIINKHIRLTGLANKHIYILECIISEMAETI
jgi:hypothetical protein